MSDFDDAAAEYIEHLWRSGAPEAAAVEFLSAVGRLIPRARRGLPTAAFYVANWRRTIRRKRAVPFPDLVVRGLAGVALARGDWEFGIMLLVGFVGLLRPVELLAVKVEDFMLPSRATHSAIITLSGKKSGQRRNVDEKVVISERLVVAGLRRVIAARRRGARLFRYTPADFIQRLRAAVQEIGMSPAQVTGYSLRRGGATWFLLTSGNMASTTVHGLWADERTARIYIDGAMAQQARWALSQASEQACSAGATVAVGLLRQEELRLPASSTDSHPSCRRHLG